MSTELNVDNDYTVVLIKSESKGNQKLYNLLLSLENNVNLLSADDLFDLNADGAIENFVLILEENYTKFFFADKRTYVLRDIPIITYTEKYEPQKIKELFSLGIREVIHSRMDPEEIGYRIQATYIQRANYNEMQSELTMANDSMDQMENAILQFENLSLEISLLNDQLQKEIEERKKVEDSLKLSQEQLKDAIATKDRFFSIIAHDLKNPFNALIGLSEVLLKEYDYFDDDQKKLFLGDIKDASENTFRLLQELLEWSRAQMGKIEINHQRYLLSDLVDVSVKPLISQAQAKDIKIKNNIPKGTTVLADKYMLTTVLRNLLSNGIKFTPLKGEVGISASRKNKYVEIRVSDSGVGIPEKHVKMLFKIDEQVRTKGTSNEKGTGLGLILCKEFIEKNNGRIWVESEVNKGSTFFLTLPE